MVIWCILRSLLTLSALGFMASEEWDSLRTFAASSSASPAMAALARKVLKAPASARADSTLRNYHSHVKRFISFRNGLDPEAPAFPSPAFHVAMFFMWTGEVTESASAVRLSHAALVWAFGLSGCPKILSDPVVVETFASVCREWAAPAVKTPDCPPALFVRVLRRGSEFPSWSPLERLRFRMITLLAYAGFFRISELLALRLETIALFPSYASFTICQSKTNWYRQAEEVLISRSEVVEFCPVSALTEFLAAARVPLFIQGWLCCQFSSAGSGILSGDPAFVISDSTYRKRLAEVLLSLGLDHSAITPHSFRVGGSSAASQAKVLERLIRRHGRWTINDTAGNYQVDLIEDRLVPSRAALRAVSALGWQGV